MHHFNRDTFQRFVSNNFETVRKYLSEGVFDIDGIWLDRCETNGLYGHCAGSPVELDGSDHRFTNGSVFRISDNETGVSYYICLNRRNAAAEEILESESLSLPDGLVAVKLTFERSFKSNSPKAKSVTEQKLFRYTYSGKTLHAILRPSFDNPREEVFFLCDNFTGLPVDSRKLWMAFFDLYYIVAMASDKKESSGAAFDLEQNVGIVNGEKSRLRRTIIQTADQFNRYITEAFGLDKSDIREKFGKRDENGRLKNGYDARLHILCEYIKKGSPVKDDDRIRRAILSIVQLQYLMKVERNEEAHNQLEIPDSTGAILRGLLFDVMLIYVLSNELGLSLYIDRNLRLDCISDLCVPVTIQRGLRLNGESVEAYNGRKHDAGNHGKAYIVPFTNYDVYSLPSRGEDGKWLGEVSTDNLSVTNLSLRREGDRPCLHEDSLLQKLSQSELYNYDPLLKEISGKLNVLGRESVTREEFSEAVSDLSGQHKEMFDLYDKEFRQVNGNIRKINRKLVLLTVCVLLPILTIGTLLLCANNRNWAVHNEFCYSMSQSWLGFCSWKEDIPFLRAKYIEQEIRDKISKGASDNGRSLADVVFTSEINDLRQVAADCYNDAISSYKKVLADSTRLRDNGERAYRLACMLFNRKGNDEGSDAEALKYAGIAACNYPGALGLYALLNQRVGNADHTNDGNLYLDFSSKDDFAPLYIAENDFKRTIDSIENGEITQATGDSILAIKKRIEDIGIAGNDASEQASLIQADLMLNGYTDSDGNYVVNKDLLGAMNALNVLVAEHNSSLAMALMSWLYANIGQYDIAADALVGAYCAGYRSISSIRELASMLGMNDDDIRKRWPQIDPDDVVSISSDLKSLRKAVEKGNFNAAVSIYGKAADKQNDNLHLINPDESYMKLILQIPDSAESLRRRLSSASFNKGLKFTGNPDSVTRAAAAQHYLDAMFAANGYGRYNGKADDAAADSLLALASAAGMVDADITLSMRRYDRDIYHLDFDDIFKCMNKAAEISDKARIWLADKTRLRNSKLSLHYVGLISDTLNTYRNMRLTDAYMLDFAVSDSRHEIARNPEFLNALRNLRNGIDYHAAHDPEFMSSYLAYLSAAYTLFLDNPKESVSSLSILSAALCPGNPLPFHTIEFYNTVHPENPIGTKEIKPLVDLYSEQPDSRTSPFFRSNLKHAVSTSANTLNPVVGTVSYFPAKLLEDMTPFEPIRNIFNL